MSRELKAWQVGILTPPPSIIQLQINPVCAVFFFLTDKRSPKHFTDVNKELATVCVIYFMLKKNSYFKLGLSLGPSETLKVVFFPIPNGNQFGQLPSDIYWEAEESNTFQREKVQQHPPKSEKQSTKTEENESVR